MLPSFWPIGILSLCSCLLISRAFAAPLALHRRGYGESDTGFDYGHDAYTTDLGSHSMAYDGTGYVPIGYDFEDGYNAPHVWNNGIGLHGGLHGGAIDDAFSHEAAFAQQSMEHPTADNAPQIPAEHLWTAPSRLAMETPADAQFLPQSLSQSNPQARPEAHQQYSVEFDPQSRSASHFQSFVGALPQSAAQLALSSYPQQGLLPHDQGLQSYYQSTAQPHFSSYFQPVPLVQNQIMQPNAEFPRPMPSHSKQVLLPQDQLLQPDAELVQTLFTAQELSSQPEDHIPPRPVPQSARIARPAQLDSALPGHPQNALPSLASLVSEDDGDSQIGGRQYEFARVNIDLLSPPEKVRKPQSKEVRARKNKQASKIYRAKRKSRARNGDPHALKLINKHNDRSAQWYRDQAKTYLAENSAPKPRAGRSRSISSIP